LFKQINYLPVKEKPKEPSSSERTMLSQQLDSAKSSRTETQKQLAGTRPLHQDPAQLRFPRRGHTTMLLSGSPLLSSRPGRAGRLPGCSASPGSSVMSSRIPAAPSPPDTPRPAEPSCSLTHRPQPIHVRQKNET